MRTPAEERFWAKVDKNSGPDGCWLWTAHCKDGYGRFRRAGAASPVQAHRFAYELAHGPIPPGLQIDHRYTCPKNCVNPAHLRPATRKQQSENLAGAHKNSRSGIRGVSWDARDRKWRTAVVHNRVQYSAGYFTEKSQAEQAVINLRNRLFTHNDIDRNDYEFAS